MSHYSSVKPLRRRNAEPFPNLWPQRGVDETLGVLKHNLPEGKTQTYSYVTKGDINGELCSVIVQPRQSVLYRADSGGKFQRWFIDHAGIFLRASDAGAAGIVVGKLSGLGVFHVFYVIGGSYVFLDEENIKTFLRLRDFPTMWVTPAPVQDHLEFTLDSAAEVSDETRRKLLGDGESSSLLGFPCVPSPVSGDGSARMMTSANHMRFMSYKEDIT